MEIYGTARITEWALDIAIGLQVLDGTLIIGILALVTGEIVRSTTLLACSIDSFLFSIEPTIDARHLSTDPGNNLHPGRHANGHRVLPRTPARFQQAKNVEWTRAGFVGDFEGVLCACGGLWV
jgi:hypothetical protein